MRYPEGVIQEVRSRASIVEVVGRHVTLRRTGKNWKGLCPFHNERTPSFVVSEERGVYHCFGCGAGGDVFRFVMEVEGLGFREAVERLAEQTGVELPRSPGAEPEGGRDEHRRILDLLELAARYYRYHLEEGRAGEKARAYLQRREVPAEAAERFRLGCAPAGWDNLTRFLKRKGVDLGLAEKAGLVAARASGGYYDRLRDRLVFPIQDPSGRVVSFGGRVLGEGEPKYLNGPETPVFRKRALLYGLHQSGDVLRRERRALLVEGYLDVISLHARGHAAAVATLGTALGAEHVRVLRRRVDRVVLVYDGDEAGRRAAYRSLEVFLAEGMEARVAFLPPEHDPDSFVRSGGDLAGIVEAAPPLFEAYLESLPGRHDLGSVSGRVAAAREVAEQLRWVTDPIALDLYAARAADVLGVDERHLRARIPGPGRREPAPAGQAPAGHDPLETALVGALVMDPACREAFRERGVAGWMRDPLLREAAVFAAGRAEPPGALPMERAPEPTRALLARILLEERGTADYEALEQRLRLRHLRERSAELVREIRRAERSGDAERVTELQRQKADLDRRLAGG